MKSSNESRGVKFNLSQLSIRLPLLICFVLLITILIFSWTSYLTVKEGALATGKERLITLTGQLSSMFQQSAQAVMSITRDVAKRKVIKDYVRQSNQNGDSSAMSALRSLQSDSTTILAQLVNTEGQPLLNAGNPEPVSTIQTDSTLALARNSGDSACVSKFYSIKDTIYYFVAAAIIDNQRLIGYILSWKKVHASPQSLEQLSGLIGTQARLYFTNRDRQLWTNLMGIVPTPALRKNDTASLQEYASNDGRQVMSAIRPIGNTTWLIMVEFPKKKILETANLFLYKIMIIGIILLAIGFYIAWSLGKNITRPLNRLTYAASAIAEGDYGSQVPVERNDELGQLATAFNTMGAQVRSAQYDLEEKVQERTTELEKVKEAAERANQSKTRFLSGMSHEIRTPLNGILGFTDILLKSNLSVEEQREYLGHIKNAGELLSKLIGDILDLNKIEEGKLSLENDSFNFKEFIESGLYPYKFQINENGIEFHLEIDPAIPDYVISDRHRIHQLLVNLIGNSLKFTKNGSIGIKITGENITEDSLDLTIQVYDTGIGISPDKFEKIFDSFTQANESIGRNYGGSGLGLAIVKHVVAAMNGTITVTSPYPHAGTKGDVGTCFEIKLPIQVDMVRIRRPKNDEPLNEYPALNGRNISVLVVDDNIMNQKLASFLLQKLGCKVIVAGDGREAIEFVNQHSFDVVLMDVHMPVMDGYEACKVMRKQLHLNTPIIGVTANVFKDDIERCLNAGMNDHLGKPYAENQLANKINKWVAEPVANLLA